MIANVFMVLLAAFAGWWSRNRGLSREKTTEFLKDLLENANQLGEKAEAQVRELLAASLRGSEEAYKAIDKFVAGLVHQSLDSVKGILDEIRHEFEKLGVPKDELHLLRVDDSPESAQAKGLLDTHGIVYRLITPDTDLHSVIYRKVAPPSLITPKNKLFIGLKAIQVYLEEEDDEDNGEGDAPSTASAAAGATAANGSAPTA